MELGVEDGDADALGSHGVRVRPGGALDQPVETKATQVITHLRRAVVPAEESGHLPARLLLVNPVTAWTTMHSEPARAMAR